MSRTYQVIGINLKNSSLGEDDRVITILTRDRGLIRAIAPGARKTKSSLSGRCNTFVVNQLLITQGKTLDRITQAETIVSYASLSRQFGTLIASQYFAEIALIQAQENQADPRLFDSLLTQLDQLVAYSAIEVQPNHNSDRQPEKFESNLTHKAKLSEIKLSETKSTNSDDLNVLENVKTSQVTPTLHTKISSKSIPTNTSECASEFASEHTSKNSFISPLNPSLNSSSDPDITVTNPIATQPAPAAVTSPQITAIATLALICDGVFRLLEIAGVVPQVRLCCLSQTPIFPNLTNPQWRSGFNLHLGGVLDLAIVQQLQDERAPQIRDLWADDRDAAIALQVPRPDHYLNAIELTLLQHLAYERSVYHHWDALTQPHLQTAWFNVERLLRQYVQYHLGRGIQSATLLDSYFLSLNPPSHPR